MKLLKFRIFLRGWYYSSHKGARWISTGSTTRSCASFAKTRGSRILNWRRGWACRLRPAPGASLSSRKARNVMACDMISGHYDYLLRVGARDIPDYERVHREQLSRLPGVARIESS